LEIEYVVTENVLRSNNGRQTHWVKNLHWVQVDPEKVKNNDPEKIDEIGWFTFDNLPEPLRSQFHKGLEVIKNHINSKKKE
jgi:hypothetical protein